ncbi:MAG: hypothetical protein GC150_13510 [Rhizobiales bacterium]|nr:hypothetical protein [Hyphomicrobiales bacterium]
MKRLSSLAHATFALTALLALLASPPADAQSRSLESFRERFNTVISREVTANLSQCVSQPSGGQSIDITFIGAPKYNPHLEEPDRVAINNAALATLNAIRLYRAKPAENLALIQKILPASGQIAEGFKATLAQTFDAPIVIVFTTSRPSQDVVQLGVNMFGRDTAGAYSCSTTALIYVNVDSYEVTGPPAGTGDSFHTITGAYTLALGKMKGEFNGERIVYLDVSATEIPNDCPFKRNFSDDFYRYFFELRGANLLGNETEGWPSPAPPDTKREAFEPGQPVLRINARPSDYGRNGVELTFQLLKNNVLRAYDKVQTVVDWRRLSGCIAPETDATPKAVDVNDVYLCDNAKRRTETALASGSCDNARTDWETYLRLFPNGQCARLATEEIVRLTTACQTAPLEKEDEPVSNGDDGLAACEAARELTRGARKCGDYQTAEVEWQVYKASYPQGSCVREADTRLAFLKRRISETCETPKPPKDAGGTGNAGSGGTGTNEPKPPVITPPPVTDALPDGVYSGERGYTDPGRPGPSSECRSLYRFQVTKSGNTIWFSSDGRDYAGTISRDGFVSIDRSGVTPTTRTAFSISGRFDRASMYSGYCRNGFFRIYR